MATIHVFKTAETKNDAEPGFFTLRDSGLSEKGLEQCLAFSSQSEFLSTMQHVTHVVSSPLRSSIFSCRIAFDRILSGRQIIVLPELADVGSPTPVLGSGTVPLFMEFSEQIDRTALPDGWESTDPDNRFAYDFEKIRARTQAARDWLMNLARNAGKNAHIVVMTHGKTAHLVTDDFQGVEAPFEPNWDGDLCWRSYKFDLDAEKMVETPASRVRRGIAAIQVPTEDENDRAKAEVETKLKKRAPLIQSFLVDFERAERQLAKFKESTDAM